MPPWSNYGQISDVAQWMGDYDPRSAQATAGWLKEAIQHNRAQPRLGTTRVVAASGERAGWSGCGKSSAPVGEYELGYALRPPYRRHGYILEALIAVVGFCLYELGVSSVWADATLATTVQQP